MKLLNFKFIYVKLCEMHSGCAFYYYIKMLRYDKKNGKYTFARYKSGIANLIYFWFLPICYGEFMLKEIMIT